LENSIISESSFKNAVFSINNHDAVRRNNLPDKRAFDFSRINNLLKEVPRDFNSIVRHDHLSKELLNKNEVIVRVYILQMYQLANRDTLVGDKSDPYIRVTLDGRTIDEVDKHIDNSNFINWYRHYE